MSITIETLKARLENLQRARENNMQQLRTCQERETGFKYVMGELEEMIEALEGEQREQQLAEHLQVLDELEPRDPVDELKKELATPRDEQVPAPEPEATPSTRELVERARREMMRQ